MLFFMFSPILPIIYFDACLWLSVLLYVNDDLISLCPHFCFPCFICFMVVSHNPLNAYPCHFNVLTHILLLLHHHLPIFVLLLHAGPVCTGGDGQSGGGAGRAQGKSSSSLGRTSSRQGLCPPRIPAVSAVPSPQQPNQGNTALIP